MFQRPERVITMAAPTRNYKLKKKSQTYTGLPFMWLNNLKFVKLKKIIFFYLKY